MTSSDPQLHGENSQGKESATANGKRDRSAISNSILENLPTPSPQSKSSSPIVVHPQKIPRHNGSIDINALVDSNSSGNPSDDDQSNPSGCLSNEKSESQMNQNGNNSLHAINDTELPECDETFLSLLKLDRIPETKPLAPLTPREVAELELILQIGTKYKDYSNDVSWREDWNGNLQLFDKEIVTNRDSLAKNQAAKPVTIHFYDWVTKHAKHADDFVGIRLLFAYVHNMIGTPDMVKKILAYYIQRPAASIAERLKFLEDAVKRIATDPIVLHQDGWTTVKADAPDGATGGSYMIGRNVFWQRSKAIVIAFVRDEGLGDLWKCMWVDDLDTFDLETDELLDGIKRWERKIAREQTNIKQAKPSRISSSTRFEQSKNFHVKGIESGIVLATSYKTKGGRPWPARIMHVTEVKATGQLTSRRSSSKNEIHVVFLAPYWNSQVSRTTNANSSYSTGPLFEIETIDVSSDTIQEYPFDISHGKLSLERLRASFGFLGLPQSAFPRYLDSHRIAAALKAYANEMNAKNSNGVDEKSSATLAALTDTHPLSVRTYAFPDSLLNLPFSYSLEKFSMNEESVTNIADDTEEETEPIMKLSHMLAALCPPMCWGHDSGTQKTATYMPSPYKIESPHKSPVKVSFPKLGRLEEESFTIQNFCSAYLNSCFSHIEDNFLLNRMQSLLVDLVSNLNTTIANVESVSDPTTRHVKLKEFLLNCIMIKGQGEDCFYRQKCLEEKTNLVTLIEWRKSCERIYKRAIVRMGHINLGNGTTAVLTDSRCNQHITSKGSFERAVRLPAAIRGAKKAGAGTKPSMPLVTKIEESYLKLAEAKIIPMAHKASYLRRLKKKVAALKPDEKGEPLTDDSDGEGGEDTKGSRGSYTAAVIGVAAALKGVDMVVGGSCVNGFCAIRPPGHHAGRELRPMNAISNGFCLLNAAACAALYATSPLSEGGLGLKRVCVVDIDVHHGNGTQDILASTYDPRFLYVSTHAGGKHINGYPNDKDNDGIRRSLNNKDGIFPGRCGDTNPHEGVMNIPLGQKITPLALGTALVHQVKPAIENFSPELIIISAGFDAHMNDPLGLGGLSAEDFGTVTKELCRVATKVCSGRIISVLEGGYGVPCCRPMDRNSFLPDSLKEQNSNSSLKLLKLGDDLPDSMEDPVDVFLAQKLDKCHQEGFLDCVKHHVLNLSLCSDIEKKW